MCGHVVLRYDLARAGHPWKVPHGKGLMGSCVGVALFCCGAPLHTSLLSDSLSVQSPIIAIAPILQLVCRCTQCLMSCQVTAAATLCHIGALLRTVALRANCSTCMTCSVCVSVSITSGWHTQRLILEPSRPVLQPSAADVLAYQSGKITKKDVSSATSPCC